MVECNAKIITRLDLGIKYFLFAICFRLNYADYIIVLFISGIRCTETLTSHNFSLSIPGSEFNEMAFTYKLIANSIADTYLKVKISQVRNHFSNRRLCVM